MPGYDARDHRRQRQAWLEQAKQGEYDTSWLPGFLRRGITDIGLVPGLDIVQIHFVQGTLADAYRRISWRGDASFITPVDWRGLVERKGWTVTPVEEGDGWERLSPAPRPTW